ncbi:MAG: DNA methyltransferase [Thermoguttaceae bacterium]
MDVRTIQITPSALAHGRLNIRACGRSFFPRTAFGNPSQKKGRGENLRVRVRGLTNLILTDIPTDNAGRPRWFFRERGWVRDFVRLHHLQPGSKVAIRRLSAIDYEVAPFDAAEIVTTPLLLIADLPEEAHGCNTDAPAPSTTNTGRRRGRNGDTNKLGVEDRPAHDWYRFVLSYPPHLVSDYIQRFELNGNHCVLDPFCGTGTTLVECQKRGIRAIGVEAHPLAYFASRTKVDWRPDADRLIEHARLVAGEALEELGAGGVEDHAPLFEQPKVPHQLRTLNREAAALLLSDSISPLPLHKALILLDVLEKHRDERYIAHERLALAKALVCHISNLHFGPEVGVGPPKPDSAVVAPWLACVESIAADLRQLPRRACVQAEVHHADARHIESVLAPQSIDAVITSPPYPNEKDYTRTTRLESVLLGFVTTKAELRLLKRSLIRSNTRGVYKGDDDDKWISRHPEIQRIATAIESRRLELGKTSGFERMYHRVAKLYFGGMARHLAELTKVLRPGARLAFVVGDQASYLRVMIRTGEILATIGRSLGYELVCIDLFRTRLATATKEQLREEVVVFRWPGPRKKPPRRAPGKVQAAR